jgi:hypothetical protein
MSQSPVYIQIQTEYIKQPLSIEVTKVPVTQVDTIQGYQISADYITLSCQPTGYQTIFFQPLTNWEIPIPFLAKGENIFTVTAYNDSGQVVAEARTTYNPVVQIANSSIKVRPYIMTPQGPIPMNPRILKDGRIVQIETRMGAADGNAIVTGWRIGTRLGTVTASPRNASAVITGWRVGARLGTIIGSSREIVDTSNILYAAGGGVYDYVYYTAPNGQSIYSYNIIVGSEPNGVSRANTSIYRNGVWSSWLNHAEGYTGEVVFTGYNDITQLRMRVYSTTDYSNNQYTALAAQITTVTLN